MNMIKWTLTNNTNIKTWMGFTFDPFDKDGVVSSAPWLAGKSPKMGHHPVSPSTMIDHRMFDCQSDR